MTRFLQASQGPFGLKVDFVLPLRTIFTVT
jgi:hypothetical protein